MNIYSIYKATNLITGKVYIGFDSNWPNRMNGHKFAHKNIHTKFHNSIKKYGWNNFTWDIIYQSKDADYTLNVMENYFITYYDSYKSGYNMTLGGDGILGFISSSETRKKQSIIRVGIIFSEEHKRKLSMAAKISKNFKGRTHSTESKLKMANSAKNRIDRKKLRCSCIICHQDISNNHLGLHYKKHL